MKSWNFHDVDVDTQISFPLQFLDKCVEPGDVAGVAEFRLGQTGFKFQLRAIWNGKHSYQLQLDWSTLDIERYIPFPYPQSDGIASLKWSSECCLVIQENISSLHDQYRTPVLAGARAMVEWMGCYGNILGPLSLCEMTLPGSQNSATYKSTASWLMRNPVRCQNLSLTDQLCLGIRVLDLPIAQCGDGKFMLSHDRYSTSYSLQQALNEVTDFIDQTTKEIVILDIHQFTNISSMDYNFSELKEQLNELLNGYDLPAFDGCLHTCLHDLWSGQAAGKRRVIVAWSSRETMEPEMWPGVNHEFYWRADTENKLHLSLDKTLGGLAPVKKDNLWSVCVFVRRSVSDPFCDPFRNAKHLSPKIDSWFHGCADWTMKANIISTDFCGEYNNIIQASVCANIVKGAKKLKS